MKKILKIAYVLILSAIICFAAASCDEVVDSTVTECVHEWTDATCTTAKSCSKCSVTEGEALGHTWTAATCTTPKTCSVCSATDGQPLGHTWTAATCTAPKTCSVCSAIEGSAIGHAWIESTFTTPKTCSVCSATEGTVLQCTHEPIHKTTLDVSSYALCSDSISLISCECGQVKTLEADQELFYKCDMIEYYYDEYEDDNGATHISAEFKCMKCLVEYTVDEVFIENDKPCTMAFSVTYSVSKNGSVIICGTDVLYESVWHSGYSYNTVYFDENSDCGCGYYKLTCDDCEAQGEAYLMPMYSLEVTEDATQDIDGVTHLITKLTCPDCGLIYVIDEYSIASSTCISQIYQEIKVYSGEEVIYTEDYEYTDDKHEYTYEYMLTDDAQSCADGVITKATCSVCGNIDYNGLSHGHIYDYEEIEISDCGSTVEVGTCTLCGNRATDFFDGDYACDIQYGEATEQTDSDGVVHYISEYTCPYCGLIYRYEAYDIALTEPCYKEAHEKYSVSDANGVIAQSYHRYQEYEHDYEITDVMLLGTSCDDGYIITYTCTVCEHTYTEEQFGYSYRHEIWQPIFELHEDAAAYDFCERHTFAVGYCLCQPDVLRFEFDDGWGGYDQLVNYGYSCSDCNLRIKVQSVAADSPTENGHTETEITYVYKGDTQIASFEKRVEREHSYDYPEAISFTLNTESCTDGWTATFRYICTECGYSYVGEESGTEHKSRRIYDIKTDSTALQKDFCDEHEFFTLGCCPSEQEEETFLHVYCGFDFINNPELEYECEHCSFRLTASTDYQPYSPSPHTSHIDLITVTLYSDTEQLFRTVGSFFPQEHSFDITVSPEGNTCDTEYSVTYTCDICDYTDTLELGAEQHHYANYTYTNDDNPDCTARVSMCVRCEKIEQIIFDNCRFEETDEMLDGFALRRCEHCGITYCDKRVTGEKDANCVYTVTGSRFYYNPDGTVLFEIDGSEQYSEHGELEYTYTVGENCLPEVHVIGTCTECGNTAEEFYCGAHYVNKNTYTFDAHEQYGFCDSHRLCTANCVCSESIERITADYFDSQYEHESREYSCPDCSYRYTVEVSTAGENRTVTITLYSDELQIDERTVTYDDSAVSEFIPREEPVYEAPNPEPKPDLPDNGDSDDLGGDCDSDSWGATIQPAN